MHHIKRILWAIFINLCAAFQALVYVAVAHFYAQQTLLAIRRIIITTSKESIDKICEHVVGQLRLIFLFECDCVSENFERKMCALNCSS